VMPRKGPTEALRENLEELFDYTLRPVRVIPYNSRGFRAGVIYYQPRIPESLSRLIVLDASHTIRLLTSKHDTTLHTTPVDCAVKTFEAVTVKCIQQGAGKDSLASALRSRKSVVLQELVERVKAIPAGEAALLVTFKDEPKDKGRGDNRYVALLMSALRKAGVDVDSLLPDGRRRFEFITWGRHLGVCGFSYCKHLFAVGVTRRQELDIASAIAGQNDDLNSRFADDLEEVSRVELSEMFHHLMQFAGRGSCRNTVDGRAEAMQLTVICNDVFPAELWQAAMPGVVVHEARSKHATRYHRSTATAEAILKAFTEVRPSDDYVSARTIKALAGLSDMRAHKFSEALAKVRKQGVKGWAYMKERRGFVRCEFTFTPEAAAA
jgi:hypothetical protein